MGFKMKGSSFYGKTIKQSGRVPSPFKQTKEFKRKDDPYTYRLDKDGKPEYKDLKTGEWKYAKGGQEEIKKAAPKTEKSNNETSIKDGGKYSLDPNLSLNPRMRRPKLTLTKPKYVPMHIGGKLNPDWYLGVNKTHDNWEEMTGGEKKNETPSNNTTKTTKTGKGDISGEGYREEDYDPSEYESYREKRRISKVVDLDEKIKKRAAKLKDISSTDEEEGVATKRGGKLINKKGEKRHAVGRAAQWVRRGILKGRKRASENRADRKRQKANQKDRDQALTKAEHEGRLAAAREGRSYGYGTGTPSQGGKKSGGGKQKYNSKADRRNSINTASQLLSQ